MSELVERAWDAIDADRLRDLALAMVSTPSPTGDEAALARLLTGHLAQAGLEAAYQEIDERQGNAVGRLRGDGSGADLLLYAPIDTLSVGTAEEDVPYVGDALRPDMRAEGRLDGDTVVGLGASNPKGHAACVVEAATAIAAAGLPLRGSLLVGLGAGGMPTNSRPGATRANTGQGNGCSFMLEQGVWADHAILAKPGWSVSYEEVGLCWFTVRVLGTFNYVGSRQRLPYRNAVVDAARLIGEVERWFGEYTARNTGGLVAPQGHVASVRGGWERTAAFSPAVCEFTVDLRISPRTTPADAARQFGEGMRAALARLGDVTATWEMTLSIPGSHTDPDTWIVRACERAWERVTGTPHAVDEAARTTSGATDGNILRNRGIPTARIGMPRLSTTDGSEVDFPLGMNAASLGNMLRLTRLLAAAAVEACTRDRRSTGGPR
ncbi:M20 family metallopeptidase [Phytohabitans suffuscus]|uniref:Peptidase M20 n=1 Tax=Phytohabitans suffuscus TaxID=624315 RepID=A0A6F8YVC5_9ACTN|nr:deacylase [Phytohabitans suffuscus]BCB90110.1 peptidase M20 [Phytohabitans suffuscus]